MGLEIDRDEFTDREYECFAERPRNEAWVRSACGGVAACAAAALIVALAGCADSGRSCGMAAGARAESFTIAAGEICLSGVEARVRRDGHWTSDGVTVDLERRGDATIVRVSSVPGVEAFALRVPGVTADRILQQGYQSWGFSGTTRIPSLVPLDDDGEPVFRAARTGDVFDEVIGVSYGSAVLGGEQGLYLTVGAVSSLHASTGIAAVREPGTPDGTASLRIVYGVAREVLPAESGVVQSEPIALVSSRDAASGLDRLAELIAEALPRPRREPRPPPGGWFSWNERFAVIDEAYIRAHVAIVRGELAPHGLPLVEIDDGWEVAWGDWRPNQRFPGGMDALAAEITSAGLVAGVWLAPFLIDTDSEVGRAIDPAALVRSAGGQPIVHAYTGATRKYFVLDGSNPEGMSVVTNAVACLAAAGFRFFKLDFLYAGALPGTRARPVTGVEALRNGLELLRRAAGGDAIVNACGAPIYPVLGLADSLRIGPDTAFAGAPLAVPLVQAAARSYAARAHLFPLVWPDADQAQVRTSYQDGVARAAAATAALAGPAYSLGDDLAALAPARLALELTEPVLDIALTREPARALDLLAAPAESIVATPFLEVFTTPDGTASPPPRDFAALGASGRRYRVRFRWEAPQDVTIERQ